MVGLAPRRSERVPPGDASAGAGSCGEMTAFALERPRSLQPSAHRPTVSRPRLLDALGGADSPPLLVLVAPAGYGKTTLLRDWCARDSRPSAWITLDQRHEDPLALLRAIARAADHAAV